MTQCACTALSGLQSEGIRCDIRLLYLNMLIYHNTESCCISQKKKGNINRSCQVNGRFSQIRKSLLLSSLMRIPHTLDSCIDIQRGIIIIQMIDSPSFSCPPPPPHPFPPILWNLVKPLVFRKSLHFFTIFGLHFFSCRLFNMCT